MRKKDTIKTYQNRLYPVRLNSAAVLLRGNRIMAGTRPLREGYQGTVAKDERSPLTVLIICGERLKGPAGGKTMWENPVTYAVVLGTIGSLVSIGIWIGRMNSFKGSVENTLAEIKESINKIQDSIEKILFRLPPD